jgi:hypothetical protein
MRDVEHGTHSTYTNHFCRCAPCTTAASARLWRNRNIAGKTAWQGPRLLEHGIISRYNDGCRCDLCRGIAARKRAQYRATAAKKASA